MRCRNALVAQAEARVDELIRKRAEADAKRGVIVIGAPKPVLATKPRCLWPSGNPAREMHICCRVPTQDLACTADAA